jgi:hypothetical protein
MEALGWLAQHRHAFNQVDDKGFVTAKFVRYSAPISREISELFMRFLYYISFDYTETMERILTDIGDDGTGGFPPFIHCTPLQSVLGYNNQPKAVVASEGHRPEN